MSPSSKSHPLSREGQTTKTWISEGLFIAASPVVAYLITFLYQAGFADFFGIPKEFITLNLTLVFVTAGTLLILAWTVFSVGFYFYAISSIVIPIKALSRSLQIFLVLVAFLALLVYGPSSSQRPNLQLMTLSVVFLSCLTWFELRLLAQLKRLSNQLKQYWFEPQVTRKLESQKGSKRQWLIIIKGAWVVTCLGLVLYFAYSAGYATALNQHKFLVTNKSPETVVLQIQGDKLITAPFNTATNEVQRSFTILKVAEDSKLMLRLQELGPLRPEKIKSR